MFYGSLKKNDVANGTGVRVNLFVSGCTHGCKNCFNEETWNFQYGEEFTDEVLDEIIKAMAPSYVEGITILGGEPFEVSNRSDVLRVLERVHSEYPEKNIWCYTGYLAEELLASAGIWSADTVPDALTVVRNRILDCSTPAKDADVLSRLLALTDVLVDGEFVNNKRNLMLRFKGSENQRIIDMQQTIESGRITLYELPS